MTAEIPDFDKEFGFDKPNKAPKTRLLKMFGREWHLLTSINNFTFTRLAGGDMAAVGDFIYNAVIDSERTEWQRALTGVADLDGDALAAFVRRLVEVAGEDHPTTSSSGSPSSASKRTSARKSAGSSSSGRVSVAKN